MAAATTVQRHQDAGEAGLSRYLDEKEPRRGRKRLELRVSESGEATVRVVAERSNACKTTDLSQMERLLRKAENIERAGRRARGTMRRYGVHNMLRYMWVLTYAGEGRRDHGEAMGDVKRFVRKVRREVGLDVYMYSPEPHPSGHGWHVNLFVGRRLPQHRMKALWMSCGELHGFEVRVTDWGRDRSKGRSLRERVRAAAAYGAKYGAKGVEELAAYGVSMKAGQHRYEVARGKAPRWTAATVSSEFEAIEKVAELGRVVRVVMCDESVGGGLWLRFLPNAPPPI